MGTTTSFSVADENGGEWLGCKFEVGYPHHFHQNRHGVCKKITQAATEAAFRAAVAKEMRRHEPERVITSADQSIVGGEVFDFIYVFSCGHFSCVQVVIIENGTVRYWHWTKKSMLARDREE